MTAPAVGDPCLDLPERAPLPGGRQIRVVELLATGTNGGAQEHVYSLVTRLDRTRYDPLVLSLTDGSAVHRMRAAGCRVAVLDELDDTLAARLVADEVAEFGADIIHNHMFRAEVVGTRAALRLAESGVPRPYVVGTVHSSRLRNADDRELLRRLTPRMDRLIAVSRATVAKLEHEGRATVPVDLIYNGVDLQRYAGQEPCCTLPEEYGFAPGTPLVGCVARLEPEKGHPTLLEAWRLVVERVPEARLLIVGEGSRREALERQARDLGLLGEDCVGARCVGTRHARPGAKVVFTGRRDDVPAVTAALDVAVLASYREAQGITVLEAMALYRPVVASNVGGIPEMVEDGRTGLLVPPHDPQALAGAIVRLLSDHPLADTLGRAGHDLVHERFCVERMVASIESVYDEAAAVMAVRRAAVVAG
ncbi:MAG: glycosyltransferase [Chloroflexi bacterium]|nr:glycosyltransferase [Chloroflexota bacterium]